MPFKNRCPSIVLIASIVYAIFLIALFNLLSGCSTTDHIRPELQSDINYQKDLRMIVRHWDAKKEKWRGKKVIDGMGVIPMAPGYKMRVEPPGKADMITVLSCHREWKTPNPKKHGSWFSDGYYEFELWPTEAHEVKKACSFDAGVYEKEKGRHAWGLVVVEDPRATLGATFKCNGRTGVYGGTSVCQAKEGLIQSVHFDRPVVATSTVGCELMRPKDRRNWTFLMPPAECIVYFVDEKDADVFHKAVLFGYSVIPIRGVE